MKVTIPHTAFNAALKKLGSVVPSNPSQKILKSVLIKTAGKRIRMEATDLENFLSLPVEGKVEEKGKEAFPFHILNSIRFNAAAYIAGREIQTENKRYKFPEVDADSFPSRPKPKEKDYVSKYAIAGADLKFLRIATRNEQTRYAFNSVAIFPGIGLGASDGHRLHYQRFKWPVPGTKKAKKILLPLSTVNLLIKLGVEKWTVYLAEHEDDTGRTRQTGRIIGDGFLLLFKPVEGHFPDIREVIPKYDNPFVVRFKVGDLRDAINDVIVVTTLNTRAVTFNPADGSAIELTAGSEWIGEASVIFDLFSGSLRHNEVPADSEDEVREVRFKINPALMLDAVKGLPRNEMVELEVKDADNQIVFKYDREDIGAVVMPMNLNAK